MGRIVQDLRRFHTKLPLPRRSKVGEILQLPASLVADRVLGGSAHVSGKRSLDSILGGRGLEQ